MPLAAAGIAMESIWVATYALRPLRDHTWPFLLLMLAAFALCFWSYCRLKLDDKTSAILALVFSLLFRITVLPAHPDQSEDVYRYIWDARVAAMGIDPFRFPPEAPELAHLRDSQIFPAINSKPYVTAYPPVSQALFRATRLFFGENVIPMKAVFSLLEFGSILIAWQLMRCFRRPLQPLFLVAWNPFFVFEFSHSGHSDSGMIFLLLLSIWLMTCARYHAAFAGFAGAVLSKLHPLLWVQLYGRRMGWRAALTGTAAGLALLSFYFTPATFIRYVQELRLYYRLFEFNAGIHYLLTWIGRVAFNQSWDQRTGPYLAAMLIITTLVIGSKFPLRKTEDLVHAGFWIMTADLCLATTVHPWYLSWAAFALPFFPYAFMFYWTGSVFLSYLAYQYRPVFEPGWVQVVEYLPMFSLMIYEIARKGPLLPAIGFKPRQ